MSFETNTRFRINAEETAKGWRFNGTVEYKSDKITMSDDDLDVAKSISEPLGARLYSMIFEARKAFKSKGEPIASEYVDTRPMKKLPSTSGTIHETIPKGKEKK